MASRSRILALTWAALLAGCAAPIANTSAAQDPEQRSRPPDAVYVGWRVFQGNCAGCHGPAARAIDGIT
jgi:mono/diheme cytochrome c family protein